MQAELIAFFMMSTLEQSGDLVTRREASCKAWSYLTSMLRLLWRRPDAIWDIDMLFSLSGLHFQKANGAKRLASANKLIVCINKCP